MARYGNDYVDQAMMQFTTDLASDDSAKFSMEIEGGELSIPAVRNIFRFTTDLTNLDLQEAIAKECIIGKNITFYADDQVLGSLRLNSVTDDLGAFDVMKKYPGLYSLVVNAGCAFVLKNSQPPRRSTPSGAANPIAG